MLRAAVMARSNPLQAPLEEAVRREARGELVRWSGQPSAWRAFVAASPILLLGVPCTTAPLFILGVVLFGMLPDVLDRPADWVGTALLAGAVLFGLFFAFILLAFVLVGVFLIHLPFRQAWLAMHTVHALTDKRLITIVEGRKTEVRTVNLGQIEYIECEERWDGSGVVRLILGNKHNENVLLVDTPEVRKVEALLIGFKKRPANALAHEPRRLDWSRLAMLACGIAIAVIVARGLLAVANQPSTTSELQSFLYHMQILLFFGVLPALAAIAAPWLGAARWGRDGARAGARAAIWLILAIYAMYVAFAVRQEDDWILPTVALLLVWIFTTLFTLIAAQSAADTWPRGRPSHIPRPAVKAPAPRRRLWPLAVAACAIVMVAIVASGPRAPAPVCHVVRPVGGTADPAWTSLSLRPAGGSEARAIVPLVVLPFTAPRDGSGVDQRIADQLTEDLTKVLSRCGELRVIAHQTARRYLDQPDSAAVGGELSVRYAVTGSVRSEGVLLQVGVQLIDVASRQQTWGDQFERDSGHVHEIARKVGHELGLRFSLAGDRPYTDAGAAASALAAKGWAAMDRGYTLENLTEALAHFREAHNRDRELVSAMVGIGAATVNLALNLQSDITVASLREAESLLELAVEKEFGDAEAHFYLGLLHKAWSRWGRAHRSFTRALQRNPSHPQAYAHIGNMLSRTRTLPNSRGGTEAIASDYVRYAIRLSPKDPNVGYWYLYAAEFAIERGREDKAALEWLVRAREALPSGNPLAHGYLAATYALMGDDAAAAPHAAEFRRTVPPGRFADWLEGVKEGLDRSRSTMDREGDYRRRLLDGYILAFADCPAEQANRRPWEDRHCPYRRTP
jgi:TolB-like protein/F0F1-type ATP synthase membrane subunit c/vacuolar-type H+-ATPase subunit K